MKKTYEAWEDPADSSITLSEKTASDMRQELKLSDNAKLLYQIEADTFEEAGAIHNLRMGWGGFNPCGEAEPCPKCGAYFYPAGSGECWRCG